MTPPGEPLSKNLTPEQFDRFRNYINLHSGIYLEETKMDSLRISLVTRATRFGYGSLDEYFDVLSTDETEFRELLNLVTINETSFFRFPAQYDAMRDHVIPKILAGKAADQKDVRVWSAGCSTGEEPYTIAMTLLDAGIEGLGFRPEVTGTDVSTNALDRARAGVYPARALHGVPHDVVSRYFEPTSEGHRIAPQIRRIVDFSYHNLIKEPYPFGLLGNWDIIFCRNVTIYFQLESTRRVVDNFFESLNPGGYLFIGHSETLTSITDRFEPVEVGGVFLYRKPSERPMRSFADRLDGRSVRNEARRTAARKGESASGRAAVKRAGRVAPGSTPESASVKRAADSLLARARLASSEGRGDETLEAAQAALAVDPSRADAHLLAAYGYADTGAFEAALAEANRALELDPLMAAARYVLGLIYLRTDRPDDAVREFKRTIYIDSDFVLAYFSLANLHKARGERRAACAGYRNCLDALRRSPEGAWTAFLGGFRPDLLAKTCERSLLECR